MENEKKDSFLKLFSEEVKFLTPEEQSRFQRTPGLFLFKQLPHNWSISRVSLWLFTIQLSELEQVFKEESIDGDKLLFLTKPDLNKICSSLK